MTLQERKIIYNKDLSYTEKGILLHLIILSKTKSFKISIRNTSAYLNIGEKSFIRYLNHFKELGYLEIIKINAKEYKYIFYKTPKKSAK